MIKIQLSTLLINYLMMQMQYWIPVSGTKDNLGVVLHNFSLQLQRSLIQLNEHFLKILVYVTDGTRTNPYPIEMQTPQCYNISPQNISFMLEVASTTPKRTFSSGQLFKQRLFLPQQCSALGATLTLWAVVNERLFLPFIAGLQPFVLIAKYKRVGKMFFKSV